MKKKWISWSLVLIYIIGYLFSPIITYAQDATAETEIQENPTGFTYKIVQPENQQNEFGGYFDLRMTPGQVQTVQIELSNGSNEEMEIEVSLNGTKTNSNGVIEYGPIAIDNDASLKYDFKDIVKAPETVKIPPNGTTMLDLNIAMPETSYDGVIAGGIQLKQAVNEEERAKQKGVINEFAFMIGMLLTETDAEVGVDLSLNEVYAASRNYRNTIFINFSNTEATYVKGMTVEAQITQKGSEAILYETKKANMQMAPNSLIDFPISMNGEQMVPGDYHAHVLVTIGEQKWEWDQDFIITDEQADKFNKQDVDLTQEQGINWLLVGLIAGIGILVGLAIFLIVRVVNRKKQSKTSARKKKGNKKR